MIIKAAAAGHPTTWLDHTLWWESSAACLTDRWRLVFKICEECRRNGAQAIHPLDCCRSGETLDQTIDLLEIVDYHIG